MDVRPAYLAALALLGLLPVAWYMVGGAGQIVALSLVSVVIIATSLALMLGARESPTA